MQQPLCRLARATTSAVMAGAALAASHAAASAPSAPAPAATAVPALPAEAIRPGAIPEDPTTLMPAIRYGRYTLVELVPEQAQRDLLQQMVEVEAPPSLDATVGDGLRHVLLRSGFQLCDAEGVAALYALPLPAAHLHLGPLVLRDALQTLAGSAWDLVVDEVARRVCFRLHAGEPSVQLVGPEVQQ